MKVSHMDEISETAFRKIISDSYSYKECLRKMGYRSASGATINVLKQKISELRLSTEHFRPIKHTERTFENVFCQASDVGGTVLRKWYIKYYKEPYVCAICGQEAEWNGKPLTLILDHINGYNHDNRLENLRWVCPNCNMQLDTTSGKNINHGVRNDRYRVCMDCGAPIHIRSTRCKKCWAKFVAQTAHELNPHNIQRDELKNLIRTLPLVQVGRYYGISDNAVRKWCRKYGLPSHATQIKAMTNEEWEML